MRVGGWRRRLESDQRECAVGAGVNLALPSDHTLSRRLLHAEGMTMEQIAERFGVTRQRVSALLRRGAE